MISLVELLIDRLDVLEHASVLIEFYSYSLLRVDALAKEDL